MKETIKKQKKLEEFKELDYPRKDLKSLIPALRKIIDDGGIVTRKRLAQLFNVKEKGGGFSHIVFAIKLYKILDKEGQSDFRINELGKEVVKEDKTAVLKALTNIEIFRDLKERYTTLPKTKASITDYIVGKHKLEKNTARTIASRYIKNMKFLESLPGEAKDLQITVLTDTSKKTKQPDFDTYRIIVDLRASLKLGEKSSKEIIEEMKKIELPDISGDDVLKSLEKIQNEDKEENKKVLLMIIELLLQAYNK